MGDQIICQDCGTIIEESLESERRPCPQCGSTRRIFDLEIAESFKIYDSLSHQHKDPKKTGRAKIKSEGFSGYEYSHDYQKIIAKQRLIDREADRYVEIVTDVQSGEIIHMCEEPLSQHTGHGTAKKRSD